MKRILLTLIILATALAGVAQVAVNTDGSNPDNSAMLDVKSTSRGILIPRMTATERDGIGSPANGLMVFVTDDNTFYYYNGTAWTPVGRGSSGWDVSSSTIYVDSTRQVVIGNNATSGTFEVVTDQATGSYSADQCTGGTASAQEYQLTYVPANAFDDDLISLWRNNGSMPVWIQYDFGAGNEKAIARYRLYWTGGDVSYTPKDWQLQGSDDGTTWTTLDTRTGESWTSGVWKEFTFSNTTHYRYYRINITANNGAAANAVYLMEIEMQEMLYTNHPTLFVADNKVGIGTETPAATLDVEGSFQFADGTEGNGKVLTSDASGNATWTDGATITNTLDDAYDQGGSGSGKNISADAGAVRIDGTDGFLVTGTYGSGNSIDTEVTGTGTRMFFYPKRAAFRAGHVYNNKWDDTNIGSYSVAMGDNTTASDISSTAMGGGSTASAVYSTAMGCYTTASGYTSTAIGFHTTAPSYSETAIGSYNTDYTPVGVNTWDASDRLFVIGNGVDINNKHNALTIYKNGRMNINDEYFMPQTDGTAGQIMQTDGAGQVSFVSASTISNTLDEAYDEGGAGAGKNITADAGAVRVDGTDGFLVTGTLGSGNSIDTELTGGGTRMFFNPKKAAFRAGVVYGDEWNDTNIGDGSIAMGEDTKASGSFSIALGYGTTSSGLISTAIGQFNTASGSYSFALGQGTTASGSYSVAMGSGTNASGSISTAMGSGSHAYGKASTAMGGGTKAFSYIETVVGSFNTDYTPASSTSWDASDRLFVIGNGQNSSNKSDALIVYKNGKSKFNGIVRVDGTDGLLVTGTHGSGNTIDTEVTGSGTRMFFNPYKAAFRAGYVDADQWDDAFIGNYSVAMGGNTLAFGEYSVALGGGSGFNTMASGDYSVAIGGNTKASGIASIAIGAAHTASGDYSVAMGYNNTASGNYSAAIGYNNSASGDYSAAIGSGNSAIGDESTAIGSSNTASGAGSFAMGYSTTASGTVSNTMGSSTTASGDYSTAMGTGTTAPSYFEIAAGSFNTDYTPASSTSWDASDRLFVIGNGQSSSNKSDALIIYKNGNTQLNKKLTAPTSGTDADLKPYIYGSLKDTDGSFYPAESTGGFTSTKESTGVYKITFDSYSSDKSYLVIANALRVSGPVILTYEKNYGYFRIRAWNLSGSLVDTYLNFVVYKR